MVEATKTTELQQQQIELCDCPRCIDYQYIRDELLARLNVKITHKPEVHRNCSIGTYVESVGHVSVNNTVFLPLTELVEASDDGSDSGIESLPLCVMVEKEGVVVDMELYGFAKNEIGGKRVAVYKATVIA